MYQPLYLIRTLIKNLPNKDYELAKKFLENRNFLGILDLTNSDIYKLRRKIEVDEELVGKLLTLKTNIEEYMSYIELPEDDYYE